MKKHLKKALSFVLILTIIMSCFVGFGATTVSAEATVKNGSTGNDVGKLQAAASLILGRAIVPDKIAGTVTATAIRDIQAKYGLSQDSIAGTATWAKINSIVNDENTLNGKIVRFETAVSRSNQVVVIANGSKTNGAPAISFNYNATHNDEWIMERQSDYTYKIKNVCSGLYLEVASFNKNAGGQIQQWQYDGQRTAHWYVFWVGNDSDGWARYCLVNAYTGMTLNLYGANAANNNKIIQWTPSMNDRANQWYIHIIGSSTPSTPTHTYIRPIKATCLSLTGSRVFGASRDGGNRAHAGIDFVCPAGTPVYAAQSGTVVRVDSSGFFQGTGSIEVKNDDGTVLRYCEIAPNVKVNQRVTQGQQIATVKKATGGTAMLHLEYYKGDSSGSLTNTSNKTYKYVTTRNYQRRSDLLDPTKFFTAPIA